MGKLLAHGHGIGWYCLTCQKLFAVDMAALIAERGGDCKIVGMKPLVCPGCGRERRTQYSITVLPKAPPPDVA
jgi:hypothetical protein